MRSLPEADAVQKWLANFEDVDRPAASDLISEVMLVSRDDFADGLKSLLDSISGTPNSNSKIALYAERPIKKVFGRIPSFFPKSRRGRAEGNGIPPIVVDPRDQEIGSEGVVANLITDYSRQKGPNYISHPGPDKLRKEKVSVIVIVTDFIGSGKRVLDMLESLGYVATLNSWKSYRLIRFVVLAYSGTAEGLKAVRSHKLKPEVSIVMGCPTIQNTFKGRRRLEVEKVCKQYPKKHNNPLGFMQSGALIAFSHGCPNNAPPILHSKASGWKPLFRGRSTGELPAELFRLKDFEQRASNLLGIREARESLSNYKNDKWLSVLKVLSAVELGLRATDDISAKTRIEVNSVNEIISSAIHALWLDSQNRLTPLGERELARFRRQRCKKPLLAGNEGKYYYPTQLRTS